MLLKEQVANSNKEDIANKDKTNQIDTVSLKKAIYSMKDKELLEIINGIFQNIEPNTTLLGGIKKKFEGKKKRIDTHYKEYFDFLIELEIDTKEYGIARMKKIEAENDTKTIPYLLTIIFFMLPYYKTTLDFVGLNMLNKVVIEEIKTITPQVEKISAEKFQEFLIEVQNILTTVTTYVEGINTVIMLILSIIILFVITGAIVKSKAKVQSAIYFRSLLESAKEIKKEREIATKKQLEEQIEQVKKQQEHIENKQEKIEQRLFLLKENNK